MKNLLFGLIATVFITNVSFCQNDIKTKLIALENSLVNLNDNEFIYTIDKVTNNQNNYDSYGQNSYEVFTRIDEFLEQFNEKPDYDKEVKSNIENEIKKIVPYNTNFKDDVRLIYDSYTKSLKFKFSIQISKAYEGFIFKNFQNQLDAKDLLQLIANTKYSTFKAKGSGKRSFTVRENCANNCMQEMFSNFNPIQWAEFTIGFLGGSLFWAYGSCWYECW